MGCRSRAIAAAVVAILVGGLALVASIPTRDKLPHKASAPPRAAQESPAINLRGFDPLVLVHEPRVQAELALAHDQRDEVQQLVEAFLERLKPIAESGRNLADMAKSEQSAAWTEMTRARQELSSEYGGHAMAVLRPEQQDRLRQIALQLRRDEAFYQPDVVRTLELTEEQIHKVTHVRMTVRQEAKLLYERQAAEQLSKEELQSAVKQLRATALKQHEATLSPDQQTVYSQLHGKPIDFTRDDLGLTLQPKTSPSDDRRVQR